VAKWCMNGTEHDFVGPVENYSGAWGYYCDHCNEWRYASVVGGRVLDRKSEQLSSMPGSSKPASNPVQRGLFRND